MGEKRRKREEKRREVFLSQPHLSPRSLPAPTTTIITTTATPTARPRDASPWLWETRASWSSSTSRSLRSPSGLPGRTASRPCSRTSRPAPRTWPSGPRTTRARRTPSRRPSPRRSWKRLERFSFFTALLLLSSSLFFSLLLSSSLFFSLLLSSSLFSLSHCSFALSFLLGKNRLFFSTGQGARRGRVRKGEKERKSFFWMFFSLTCVDAK